MYEEENIKSNHTVCMSRRFMFMKLILFLLLLFFSLSNTKLCVYMFYYLTIFSIMRALLLLANDIDTHERFHKDILNPRLAIHIILIWAIDEPNGNRMGQNKRKLSSCGYVFGVRIHRIRC